MRGKYIFVIILILLAALIAWFFFRGSSSTPPPASDTNGDALSNPFGTPGGSATSDGGGAIGTVAGAHPLTFDTTRDNTSEEEVAGLFADDVQQLKDTRIQMGLSTDGVGVQTDSYDLNSDGKVEVFTYGPEDSCGSAGCNFEIYQKQGDTWQRIYQTYTYDQIQILPATSNEYHSILVYTHGSTVGTNVEAGIVERNAGGVYSSRSVVPADGIVTSSTSGTVGSTPLSSGEYQVQFQTTPKNTSEEAVGMLFESELQAQKAERTSLGLSNENITVQTDSYDLNGDGVLEVFVHGPEGLCGSGGCEIQVFQQFGTVWQSIFDAYTYEVEVLPTSTGGFHDLLVYLHGAIAGKIGYETQTGIAKWSNGHYHIDLTTLRDTQ